MRAERSVPKIRVLRRIKEWNQSTLSLFACDCVGRRGLRYYQAAYPDDDRLRLATATARRFDRGNATVEQLNAAQPRFCMKRVLRLTSCALLASCRPAIRL
jgi:hypothetical protein